MATHGRNDKGFEANSLERPDRGLNNGAVIRDSPAAAYHCHCLTRSDFPFQPQSIYLRSQFLGYIPKGRSDELLPDANHFGKVHFGPLSLVRNRFSRNILFLRIHPLALSSPPEPSKMLWQTRPYQIPL